MHCIRLLRFYHLESLFLASSSPPARSFFFHVGGEATSAPTERHVEYYLATSIPYRTRYVESLGNILNIKKR